MPPVTLIVALVGDPRRPHQETASIDFHTPYYDRPKVELEVDEKETLGATLTRAAEELMPGHTWPAAFVDFYREGAQPRFQRELLLLDGDGRVRSTGDWRDEPLDEVLRAGDAGVLGGDPRRPYLLNQHGIGNGILSDWPTFVELWRLWWDVASRVATVGGVWAFFKLAGHAIRQRGPESATVIERHADDWEARGLRPDRLLELLGTRPWHPADLAEVLGCSEGEAVALLTGLGFGPRGDGLWVHADDEGSRLVRGNIDIVLHAAMTTKTDAVERELQERAARLIATGRAEPVDWERVGDLPSDHSRLPPPPVDDEFSPREELGFGIDELRMGVSSVARALWGAARQRRRRRNR